MTVVKLLLIAVFFSSLVPGRLLVRVIVFMSVELASENLWEDFGAMNCRKMAPESRQ